MATPYGGSVEAEYEDGYVHSETEHQDISPFDHSKNILNDIIQKRPEAEHGRMVRFSMFYKNHRYDVPWSDLPDNARPVRWKQMEADSIGGQVVEVRMVKLGFGYQYNDESGKNFQEVIEF